MNDVHKRRILELRRKLRKESLDGFIVTHLDFVRYLSGFTGTAGILAVTHDHADFLTDSRYKEQASQQVKVARIHQVTGEALQGLKTLGHLQSKNIRLGYSAKYLTVSALERLKQILPDALFIAADEAMLRLGWVKDKAEIASIKKAVQIADTAFARILPLITPGTRENEVAAELEYQMMMMGSQKPAFESIVASGHRSAMPHGIATTKKIGKGDFVTLDFGATVDGYVSDITRTVVVGKANARQKKIYNIVLRAHLAGIKKVRAGILARDVDAAARNVIKRAGYGTSFGHGTGHGIGFYIHTGPSVSSASPDVLAPNHVVTIEPGIYLPGWGGVRIEDDVLVTVSGGQPLNRAEKKLLEL